jgi:hypothetical protein
MCQVRLKFFENLRDGGDMFLLLFFVGPWTAIGLARCHKEPFYIELDEPEIYGVCSAVLSGAVWNRTIGFDHGH